MNEGQLLLLWPGGVRRKREGDFGQIGLALLDGTNNCPSFINKISSASYCVIFDKIAGLCTSSWFLGLFLGPTIGGFLVEHYGFPRSAIIYTIFFIFTAILDIAGVKCNTSTHLKGYDEVK